MKKMILYPAVLLALVGMVVFTGCPGGKKNQITSGEGITLSGGGTSGGSGGGSDTGISPSYSFTGTWKGTAVVTWSDPGTCGGPLTINAPQTVVLTQTGNSLAGTYSYDGTPYSTAFACTVSNNSCTFKLPTGECPDGVEDVSATITIISPTEITNVTSGASCRDCGSGADRLANILGTATFTKQ